MGFANRSLLLLLVAFAGCNSGSGPPVIVIGHVSDKTRQDKAGDQAELGIRLALNQLDNEALAKEFGGRPIQVHHTDTRGQLDAFESQAVRLDSINRSLALFGGLSVPETIALQNAKVPLLTLHGQPIAGASSFVFFLGMSPVRQGEVLAKIVMEDDLPKHITIMMDDKREEAIAAGESFQRTFVEGRKHAKGVPVAVTTLRFGKDPAPPRPTGDGKEPTVPTRTPISESKWRELIKRLIHQNPDMVVFAGAVQDFNAWHNIVRQDHANANLKLVYAGPDGSQRSFDLDGGDKVTVTMASAFYADPKSEKITAFLKAYQGAFKIEADVNAAVAYDGFRMLVEAMKRSGTQLTPDKVREELLKTKDFDGLTGPLTVTPDRQIQRTIYGVSWQSGNTKLIRAFPIEKDTP